MKSQRPRALVVDDEGAIRQLVAAALRRHGFDCDIAADGEEAMRKADEADFDVVVTDLKMPNRNGHSVALELLGTRNRPLIVVHTGVAEPRLAKDLLARGVDDVIFKPTDVDLLAAKVKVLLERRQSHHGAATGPGSGSHGKSHPAGVNEPGDAPITLPVLNARLSELSRVLPISPAALDVYQMTRSYDWQVSQIAAAIQRDASLAADVLRLANSSLFGTQERRIADLEEAVLRIGQRRVGELALAATALARITPDIMPWMDLELEWKRSMAAGIALEAIVEQGGHQAIEAGLLLSAVMHSLGRIALGTLFPPHYTKLVATCEATGDSLSEQERRAFPTRHTEVAAYLLASWKIPPDVFVPLKLSMDDDAACSRLSEPLRTKVELVKTAITLGRLAAGRWQSWDLIQLPRQSVLNRLRIRDAAAVVRATRVDLEKLAGFRPGKPSAGPPVKATPIQREVKYCRPGGTGPDLLIELLTSLGIRPVCCPAEELVFSDGPAIVNCLGPAAARLTPQDGWGESLVIANQEQRHTFDRNSKTATLPVSYGAFRNAVLGDYLKVSGHAPAGPRFRRRIEPMTAWHAD